MHFSQAGGSTVAADVNSFFGSVDTAILDAARLTTSVMETKVGSGVAPGKAQRVLDAIATGFAKIVEGRRDMVAAHRSLAAIKDESNLVVEDYGCFSIDAAAAQDKIEA